MITFCVKCGEDSIIDGVKVELGCSCELFSSDISYLFIGREDEEKWSLLDIVPPNCLMLTDGATKTISFFEAEDSLEPVHYSLLNQ